MSLAHILLKKLKEDEHDVSYVVLSPDFNDTREWQEVAQLVVSRAHGSHAFVASGAWADKKVVPPYVYGLSETERAAVLASEFEGAGYGAWTGRILSQVRRMQASGTYPDEMP